MLKKIITITYIFFLIVVAYAQNTDHLKSSLFEEKNKADVMILGVFHFENPNLDVFKSESINMLTDEKQKEIDALLYKIEKFKPTKIIIEQDRNKADSIINVKYLQYIDGTFNIDNKSSEIYQLAFKLGKRLNLNKIYCSDSFVDWCGTDDIDWDEFDDKKEDEYLKSRNQYDKEKRYDYNSLYEYQDSLKKVLPLSKYLEILNTPSITQKQHQRYLTNLVLSGAGDNYYGSDSVSRWYRRNLRIFSNIYDIVSFDNPERILLIFGSGHVWLLSQFFKDSPDFNYIEVNEYLTLKHL